MVRLFAAACAVVVLSAGCSPAPTKPPPPTAASAPILPKAPLDPAMEAEIARRDAISSRQMRQSQAIYDQCAYEAHAQAANFRGLLVQAAEEVNLREMCVRARASAAAAQSKPPAP